MKKLLLHDDDVKLIREIKRNYKTWINTENKEERDKAWNDMVNAQDQFCCSIPLLAIEDDDGVIIE